MTANRPKETAVPDDIKWVEMTHPKIKADPARVTRKAFDDVWDDKGWKLASNTTPAKKEA